MPVDRLLQFHITETQEQPLLIAVEGRDYLSYPYEFSLTVISKHEIDQTILGKCAYFKIQKHVHLQCYHGIIECIRLIDQTVEGYAYQLILCPWFKLLQLNHDYRCFVKKKVIEIVKIICQQYLFYDLDLSKLTKAYEPIDFSMQYDENSFHYLSRLLSEQGIYYYFEHFENKHVMVLEDSGDFHHQKFEQGLIYREQIYHLPRLFKWHHCISKIENKIEACGNYLGLYPGKQFELNEHPFSQELGHYYIYSIAIHAHDHTQRRHLLQNADKLPPQSYTNHFHAYPISTKFTTRLRYIDANQLIIQKPIAALSTAIVTGPKGQEIYTNAYAYIKIQFHFDRYGQFDENSSNWVPTRQIWAGKGYGTQFIPRIGDEVLVDFENGDPDKPIVIGSLANANNLPAFATNKQSGFYSHSLGSNLAHGNILRFDDIDNREEFYCKAQKDFFVTVNGSSQKQIHDCSQTHIQQGNFTETVKGILKIQAQKEIKIACGKSAIIINTDGTIIKSDCIDIN